jgi:NADPH:quinone reductase-like Zn-dependent oxidoreductase
MGLMPGETILITGGAGMVGQAATAIARWRGAEPIVADRRKPVGIEHFIDTTSTDIPEAVLELTDGRGADLALDTKGGELFGPVLRSLRFDGRMTGIFSAPNRRPASRWLRSTTASCTSPGLLACSWTGRTSRASSTSSVRCSTGASCPPGREDMAAAERRRGLSGGDGPVSRKSPKQVSPQRPRPEDGGV